VIGGCQNDSCGSQPGGGRGDVGAIVALVQFADSPGTASPVEDGPRRPWAGALVGRLRADSCRQRHTRDFLADRDEAILQRLVIGLQVRLHALQVIEIPTRHIDLRIITRREPGLGQMRLIHVVGRTGAAHLGRHPPRLQRIREYVRPAPRNCEGQHRIVKLALRVSDRTVPGALLPESVVEIGVGMPELR
jgi:hypothetical protein